MTDQNVKPCPFCGGKKVTIAEGDSFRWRKAVCDNCGATAPEVPIQTFGAGNKHDWERRAVYDAVEAWNTRA